MMKETPAYALDSPEVTEAVEKLASLAEQLDTLAAELETDDRAWLRNAVNLAHGLPGDPDLLPNEVLFTTDEPSESSHLTEFYYERIEPLLDVLGSIDWPAQKALFEALNISPEAFGHNFSLNRCGNFLDAADWAIEQRKSEHKHLTWPVLFLPELMRQNAQHLRAVIARKRILDGHLPLVEGGFDPRAISDVNLASRSFFFEPAISAEMKDAGFDKLIEAGVMPPAELIDTNVRIVGDPAEYQKSSLDPDILASIVYYLVSNAGKKMIITHEVDDENGDPVSTTKLPIPNAQLDVRWSPLKHEGRDYIGLEVFDSGEHINTASLYNQLVEFAQSRPQQLAETTAAEVVEAIAKHPTNRQINIEKLIAGSDLPFFRGFSAMGSTGLGLDETQMLATKGGGAIMMNNVHGGSEGQSGVAVTVLIPQDLGPADLEDIRHLTEKLKDELQSGKHTFDELGRAATGTNG